MHILSGTKLVLAAAALGLAAFSAMAQDLPKGAVVITPDNIAWKPNPRAAGVELAAVVGDSTKPGTYIEYIRFPANFKIMPHTHPDDRSVVIISGTWYIGFGDKFDESKMIALPPGSYYSEPANTPHYVMTKGEPVVFQLTGAGPTGTRLLVAPPAK